MTVCSPRLFETLPQNTWLSTKIKLLYHDPVLILIKPPYLKLILNQTPESYKHLNSAPVMLVWLSHGRFSLTFILMVFPGSQHSGLIPLKTLYWGIQGRVRKRWKKGWMMRITDKCLHELHEWGASASASYLGKWLRKWHREIKHLVFLMWHVL